ncbi:MAG TPA: hypothetical protein VM914_04740 [Pyrinomonadaceae bacterium]|nr:hypothetical protein [Pyrinomonadaceae bacterium]
MSDVPPYDTIEVEIDLTEEVEIDLTDEVALDLSDIVSEVSANFSEALLAVEPTCAPQAEPVRVTQFEVERGGAEVVRAEATPAPPETQPTPAPAPQPAQPPAPQSARPTAAQPARPQAQPTAQPTTQPSTQPTAQTTAQPRAASALPPQFAGLVARTKDLRLRTLAAATFGRILKTLEALKAVENALTLQKVITVGGVFGGVRVQATALLAHLTETVVQGDDLGEEFREVLDGIRFVVAHEMGKVFSYEFRGLTSEGPSSYTRAELTRAWGLLHNCMQQTAITLARTLDPEVTGQQLFDDYRDKTENSITLYRELQLLLQKVRTAQKANGILLKHSLVRHLEHFREETMHFLMYKDWGEFGRYVDEVKRAFEEMEDFEVVLHGFAQYLSTLIHHVGMREVLSVRQEQAPAAPRA